MKQIFGEKNSKISSKNDFQLTLEKTKKKNIDLFFAEKNKKLSFFVRKKKTSENDLKKNNFMEHVPARRREKQKLDDFETHSSFPFETLQVIAYSGNKGRSCCLSTQS